MTSRQLPINIFVWCGIVFVAAFIPWGTTSYVRSPLVGAELQQIITGWNGSVKFLGVLIPHWTVVVVAGLIALLAWLQSRDIQIKTGLIRVLAIYGVLHALFFIMLLRSTMPSQLGLGSVVTLIAFTSLVFAKGWKQVLSTSTQFNSTLILCLGILQFAVLFRIKGWSVLSVLHSYDNVGLWMSVLVWSGIALCLTVIEISVMRYVWQD